MTQAELLSLAEIFTAGMKGTLKSKNEDYASPDDAFSNFKKVAFMVGTTPEFVCLVLVALKVARLSELIGKDKTAINEPVGESCLDGANYNLILHCMAEEKRNEPF